MKFKTTSFSSELRKISKNLDLIQKYFKNIYWFLIFFYFKFKAITEFLWREIIFKWIKLYIELLNKIEDKEFLTSALFLISLWSWNICYLSMNGDLCLRLWSEINFSEALLLIIIIFKTKYLEVLMNKYFDSFPLLNQ